MQTLPARPIDLVELGTRTADFARHTRAPATLRTQILKKAERALARESWIPPRHLPRYPGRS
jgi:hypothetical protein